MCPRQRLLLYNFRDTGAGNGGRAAGPAVETGAKPAWARRQMPGVRPPRLPALVRATYNSTYRAESEPMEWKDDSFESR